MKIDDLLKLDIKLLVAFAVIFQEESVSRAAERLNITQPALSKSLQRLRETFGDPLFTRQAYGLSPTFRANELFKQVQPVLESMSELLKPIHLDLATLDRQFRLKVDENLISAFIDPVLCHVFDEAPKVRLSFTSWSDEGVTDIYEHKADLGILVTHSLPNNLRSVEVGKMDGCVVLSDQHPLYHQESVTLEELIAHRTVSCNLRDHSTTSAVITVQKLRQQGYCIEPDLETDSLVVAKTAVNRGMALVTSLAMGQLFKDVASKNIGLNPIRILPLPQEVTDVDPFGGRFPIQLVWPERSDKDPAHRWLRGRILDIMRASPWIHP